MNYTLHQLAVLLKVVETGSITRAAEELHMTQPAVSIQMRNLQDQFEVPLTEVVGRRLHITPFGLEVARIAERVLAETQGIRELADAHKGILAGRLTVASVSTGKYVVPFFLAGFLKAHPGVDLLLDVTTKAAVVQRLQDNEVDFALVSQMPPKLRVEEEVLLPNRLYLVANQERHWPRRKVAAMLQEVPLIFREKGSGTGTAMEQYLAAQGVEVTRKLELTSNEAVKQAVLAGLGCSIMPEIGLRRELAQGELQIIPMAGLPICTHWRLVWLKGKRLSPVAAAWLAHVRAQKEQVAMRHFHWLHR